MTFKTRSLFVPRVNLKPYEYPEIMEFKDAMRNSYWIHSEFNYTSDIQDFRITISDKERNVIIRSMLAISQIEVSVKRFWATLYDIFPKPEIDSVGLTFAESEVRHKDAYSDLLEKLGMNNLFETIKDIPCIMERINYMERFMRDKQVSKGQFVFSLITFSLFVEHISLFSQFYTIMSFNKRKNLFKGISNAIEATSKEEELHGRFGITLYNILREENPELFTEEFYQELITLANDAFKAEENIVQWIFEDGDLDFLSREEVLNYIRYRYNNSFIALGLDPQFNIDPDLLEKAKWFDIEVLASKENDFFNKRSTDYSKRVKSITADDLF